MTGPDGIGILHDWWGRLIITTKSVKRFRLAISHKNYLACRAHAARFTNFFWQIVAGYKGELDPARQHRKAWVQSALRPIWREDQPL